MGIEIINHQDKWLEVKAAARNTIGKEGGKYPDSKWKRKILLAEHSPIRIIEFVIKIRDIPYWVHTHLVRHKIGIEHFVSTQRTDRTGIDRTQIPQGALVDHMIKVNAQALITISRKRLCNQASPETREVWRAVVNAVKAVEPELASCCVRECVYRGFCPEMKCCGFFGTPAYEIERQAYLTGSMVSFASTPPAGD